MKSLITLLFFALVTSFSFAQPYIGFSANDKGFGMQPGVLIAEMVDINVNYNSPITRKVTVPSTFTVNAGLRLIMSGFEEDNKVLLTPAIGYYISNWKDVSEHSEPVVITDMESKGLNFSLELAYQKTIRSSSMSGDEKRKIIRFYAAASKGHFFYPSVGVKVFFVK